MNYEETLVVGIVKVAAASLAPGGERVLLVVSGMFI
jgi:hypothetical protein